MREIGENPAHLPDGEDDNHPNHEEGEEQEEDGQENKCLTRRSITTTWTPG